MQLELDPQVAALIQQRVDTGRYANASEVVDEALRLLNESERKRDTLRAALAVGFDALDRGDVVEWTPDSMTELIQEADEMNRQGIKPNPDVRP